MSYMSSKMSKYMSVLLAMSMAVGTSVTSVAATNVGGGAPELTFTYPESIVAEDVQVDLYKGYPTSASKSLEAMISNGELKAIKADADGNFTVTEPGTYSYHISGDGYYNILKLFNITQEDIDAGKINVEVIGGKLGTNDGQFGDGYQPTVKPSQAPDTYKMDNRDAMLCLWTDEILEHFTMEGTKMTGEYDTPAFDGTDAAHEVTTQEELMEFLKDRDAKCDYMHLYSAGTTGNYDMDIPLAVFSTTEIPAGATLEEAAKLVSSNGKTTIWYQTQIHPNEPASGEAALAIIDKFINESDTKDLLNDVNLIIVPRINPDGSYLFSRATYEGFDMNRDHMALKAVELAQLHTAYRLFMAEVVLDGHEFTFYSASTDKENGEGIMGNADDLMTTPATSLNNNKAITDLALKMCGTAFEDATDAGLRVYHYGTTTNNPIGRAYFGLLDTFSFLIETRGIGAGKTNFERRVYSQEVAIMSYIKSTAENAEEIKKIVAEARQDTLDKGPVYGEENDLLYLHQTKSGETKTPYDVDRYQFYMDGDAKITEDVALDLNDIGARTRMRPTAYVIPADHENIEKILYIMDNQGAEYYKLDAGSKAKLEQYYYAGQREGATNEKDIEAGLHEAAEVTFKNGAYVIPMDQLAADVIAMTFEPDVTDSVGYDGTLYQYGLVTYDANTKDFPIYRYTGNDPRETLVSNAPMSRADVVKMMWDNQGKPEVNYSMTFKDVAANADYAEAIEWAASKGLVSGYSATAFGPSDLMTREQLATVMHGYAKMLGMEIKTAEIGELTDMANVSNYAVDAIKWAVGNKIMGTNDGKIDPAGTVTFGQAMEMMLKLIDMSPKG